MRTSIIVRGGVKSESDLGLSVKRSLSCFRKFSGIPFSERVFCAPESQFYDYESALLGTGELHGFRLESRPDYHSFGEDFSFMELALIENPGYITIVDNDFMYGESQSRGLGEPAYSDTRFGLEFSKAVERATELNLMLWGFRHHHRMGGGRSGKTAPLSQKSLSNGKFTVDLRYIRSLLVISRNAKGIWKPWSYLEDLSRVLSEYDHDNESVGRCDSTMIRFPDSRTSVDYRRSPEWKECKKSLEAEYGEELVKKCLSLRHGPNRKKV